MPSTPRISLHDCTIDLRLPSLSSLPQSTGEPPSLESLTAAALSSAPRAQSSAYLGETLLVVLHVRAPKNSPPDALPFLLDRIGDVRLYLTAASARPEPRATPLRAPTDAPKSQRGPSLSILAQGDWVPDPSFPAYAKSLVVLLRTPPDNSLAGHITAASGPQRLEAVLRERGAAAADARDAVAAISRSTRTPARDSLYVAAAATVDVRAPLELSCHTTQAADRVFVVVAVANVASDAALDVVPPAIRVAATRLVRLSDPDDDESVLRSDPDVRFHPNSGTFLQSTFEFSPRFTLPSADDDIDDDDADEADLSLLIPAFARARKRTVRLAPGELFNFVYEVVPRATSAPPNATTTPLSDPRLPRLSPDARFESAVAVAWSVHPPPDALPAAAVAAAAAATDAAGGAAERQPSSSGVLALGARRRVAVRASTVRWRPHSLASGVIVALSGPPMCAPRAMCDVRVAVRNQRRVALERAVLCVRAPAGGLTPLRTAVSLGRVAPGDTARVSLACVALDTGALRLGDVCVVERAADGKDAVVWAAPASFEVLVADKR